MIKCCKSNSVESDHLESEPTPPVCEFIQNQASGMVRSYFRKRVGHADADDLAQETVIKAWRNCRSLHDSAKVSAWVWGIARRQLIQYYRKEGRIEKVEFTEAVNTAGYEQPDPYSDAFRSGFLAAMQVCDPCFSQEQREILDRMLSGESQVEIAMALNVPVSTIRTRYQRAREKMKAIAEKCCFLKRDAFNRVIGCEPLSPASHQVSVSQQGINQIQEDQD